MAPRKRGYDETEEPTTSSPHEPSIKHQKTDRAAQAAAETNSDSSYVSAAAAIFSDSEGGSSETAQSSLDASDSELSPSSEEPSSESESEESEESENEARGYAQDDITNVRPGAKPHITKEDTNSSLLGRLKNFLPEMREADKELEREREAGALDKRNIESCEEGRPHIEMNLGLGVLEEKQNGEEDGEDDDMSDEDDNGAREDVMRRLMGERYRNPRQTMKIQEVGEG